MKALVLQGMAAPGSNGDCRASATWMDPKLEILSVPEPVIQGPHSAIIETLVCGICGSDLHCSEAGTNGFVKFGGPARLPVILGHEFAGRVVEVGAGCKNLTVGDIVTSESIIACWNCPECMNGQLNDCRNVGLLGLTHNGAFAPYVLLDTRHCYPLHELLQEFDMEEGCELGALLEPLGVAYRGLVMRSNLRAGETVVVFGLGPIGLAVGLLAMQLGARDVVGFDPLPTRVDLARSLGLHAFSNSLFASKPTLQEVLRELLDGRRADIAVEATGEVQAFYDAVSGVRAGGRVLLLGRLPAPVTFDTNYVMSNSIKIVGSRGHAGDGIFPTLIKLLAERRLKPAKMVTCKSEFGAILWAFDRARARHDCKVHIRIP